MDLKLTKEERLDAVNSLLQYLRVKLETEVWEMQAGLLLDYQFDGE